MSLKLNNRRKRPDPLQKWLTCVHATAIIALAAALVITAIAKPELETFFDRYYDLHLRQDWNRDQIVYIGVLLALSSLSSAVGLVINSRRLRRKNDHVHVTLILSLVISLIGMGLLLRKFYL